MNCCQPLHPIPMRTPHAEVSKNWLLICSEKGDAISGVPVPGTMLSKLPIAEEIFGPDTTAEMPLWPRTVGRGKRGAFGKFDEEAAAAGALGCWAEALTDNNPETRPAATRRPKALVPRPREEGADFMVGTPNAVHEIRNIERN